MTDNYKDCEDAFVTLMQTLTAYFKQSWQVADDDSVLTPSGKGSKGTADYILLYHPGSFPVTPASQRIQVFDWEIIADLYVRYYTYKKAWEMFKEVRNEIINLIHIHPTLNDTHGVKRLSISSGGRPMYMFAPNADPYKAPDFITQNLVVTVKQLVEYSGGEW